MSQSPSQSPSSSSRRLLQFTDLDQVAADARHLAQHGYTQRGNWNLGQIAGHLTDWLIYPMDGYPPMPLAMRGALWVMRHTIGPSERNRILRTGQMRANTATIPETIPPVDVKQRFAVQKLCETLARFGDHTGALHPSPLFGDMDKATTTRIHLAHCAHHLSFLIPRPVTRQGNATAETQRAQSHAWKSEGHRVIAPNGKTVEFEHPIKQSHAIDQVLIVLLDVPPAVQMPENVFGVSDKGDVVWQIERTAKNPLFRYEEIHENQGGEIVVWHYECSNNYLDFRSGKILRTEFSQ